MKTAGFNRTFEHAHTNAPPLEQTELLSGGFRIKPHSGLR
jgi:hypothetical protein